MGRGERLYWVLLRVVACYVVYSIGTLLSAVYQHTRLGSMAATPGVGEVDDNYFAAGCLIVRTVGASVGEGGEDDKGQKGSVHVLLGLDSFNNQWSDFGGGRERDTDPKLTAAREFVEETLHVYVDEKEFRTWMQELPRLEYRSKHPHRDAHYVQYFLNVDRVVKGDAMEDDNIQNHSDGSHNFDPESFRRIRATFPTWHEEGCEGLEDPAYSQGRCSSLEKADVAWVSLDAIIRALERTSVGEGVVVEDGESRYELRPVFAETLRGAHDQLQRLMRSTL